MTVLGNLLLNQIKVAASLNNARQSGAGTTNGAGVDSVPFLTGNVSGSLVLILSAVAESGTSVVGTFAVEHSDDNSTFTAVPAAALINPVTGATTTLPTVTTAATPLAATLIGVSFSTATVKRYLRVTITAAGTSPVVRASAVVAGRANFDNAQTNYQV